jgi:hypothetical protein
MAKHAGLPRTKKALPQERSNIITEDLFPLYARSFGTSRDPREFSKVFFAPRDRGSELWKGWNNAGFNFRWCLAGGYDPSACATRGCA